MSDVDQNIELPEIEEASAQKMPVGDEEQSIAATDKAGDATNPAPKRKGDTANKDEPNGSPKTKAAMINAMYKKMEGMSKQHLAAMATKMEGLEVDVDADAVELPEFNYTDELDALVESEATLSDEFKSKTAIIFETAIKSKLSEEIERLEDDYQTRLEEELTVTRSDLVEKIDSYLNYVVENWMEENRLAIHNGLRTEIAEGFMEKLKDLFTESYIEVPDSKVDLVDDLAEQVASLEEKLDATTANAIEMAEELNLYKRYDVIREAARGLAETEIEKLANLAEDLDFESEEAFAAKVKTIKESYFTKKSSSESIAESFEEDTDDDTVEVSGAMAAYVNAIKKNQK